MAAITKLSPRMLVRIEMGEFAALPAGVMARAHIRAYAAAVGLDPEEVLRGLADRLPAAPDPSDALRARARRQFAADHPVAAALRDQAEDWQRRAIQVAGAAARQPLALAGPWRYVPAMAVDAVIVAAFAALMLLGSSWIMQADMASLWHAAWWPLALSCLLMAALYWTLSWQLAGRTPGAVIIAAVARAVRRRHAAPRIARWHVWD